MASKLCTFPFTHQPYQSTSQESPCVTATHHSILTQSVTNHDAEIGTGAARPASRWTPRTAGAARHAYYGAS